MKFFALPVLCSALLFLVSCKDDPNAQPKNELNKVEGAVAPFAGVGEVSKSDNLATNQCNAKFLTNFNEVGIKVMPLQDNQSFSLQVSSDKSLQSLPSFTTTLKEPLGKKCDALYKVVLPYVFMEQKRSVKNDLSLDITFPKDLLTEVTPDKTATFMPTTVELNITHQRAFGSGEEKAGRSVFRTGKILGSLECSEPFVASCTKNWNKNVCGAFVLTPPKAKCGLKFADFKVETAPNEVLEGSLEGVVDFSYFATNKSAHMIIDTIEFR